MVLFLFPGYMWNPLHMAGMPEETTDYLILPTDGGVGMKHIGMGGAGEERERERLMKTCREF